jgi:restriction system protein
LQRAGDEDSIAGGDHHEVWALIRKQEGTVRESLRELLLDMDPLAFEHLVKRLLEEMDYQNVEVTARSGDGGVDVVGDIELGITSVREVVQVKKHRRAVQRKDLDALRGSLYRFGAVRGTIVTTSRFAKGTQQAAFATGAAPITLIDGDKLIDLLLEHGIGVRKRTIELLEVDADAFASIGQES